MKKIINFSLRARHNPYTGTNEYIQRKAKREVDTLEEGPDVINESYIVSRKSFARYVVKWYFLFSFEENYMIKTFNKKNNKSFDFEHCSQIPDVIAEPLKKEIEYYVKNKEEK